MSITEIKEGAKGLSHSERRDLVAFLLHLEESEDPDFLDEMTRKIDQSERFHKWEDVRDQVEPE